MFDGRWYEAFTDEDRPEIMDLLHLQDVGFSLLAPDNYDAVLNDYLAEDAIVAFAVMSLQPIAVPGYDQPFED